MCFRILWYLWKTILGSFIIYSGLSLEIIYKMWKTLAFNFTFYIRHVPCKLNAFLCESEMYGFGLFFCECEFMRM